MEKKAIKRNAMSAVLFVSLCPVVVIALYGIGLTGMFSKAFHIGVPNSIEIKKESKMTIIPV